MSDRRATWWNCQKKIVREQVARENLVGPEHPSSDRQRWSRFPRSDAPLDQLLVDPLDQLLVARQHFFLVSPRLPVPLPSAAHEAIFQICELLHDALETCSTICEVVQALESLVFPPCSDASNDHIYFHGILSFLPILEEEPLAQIRGACGDEGTFHEAGDGGDSGEDAVNADGGDEHQTMKLLVGAPFRSTHAEESPKCPRQSFRLLRHCCWSPLPGSRHQNPRCAQLMPLRPSASSTILHASCGICHGDHTFSPRSWLVLHGESVLPHCIGS
mmetsp:Transcript_9277/g.34320  ORF Transcript_9277/g.34320 Transcript_9277/m.34320 type:complete len:274 (+) Transcript_9277:375-1196(+)